MLWLILSAFFGAFLGVIVASLLPDYIISPLHNRAQHKRLLDHQSFKEQWGANIISFFLTKDGFNRGIK